MRHFTRLSLLAAVVLGAAAFTSPAFGARPSLVEDPFTVGSTHFLVHYESDPQTASAITQTQAGDIAVDAERAYAAELADGYAAPLSDGGLGGDNRIDIYVTDLGIPPPYGVTIPDNNFAVSPDSGYIEFDGTSVNADWGFAPHAVAHELFHLVQFGIWLSPNVADYWLYEGSADWMGYRVDGYTGDFELGPDDMALDCRDPLGTNMCSLWDDYENNGYSRWPFFEYLSETYGASFLSNVLAQGQAGAGSATAALSNALAAKGTTLADVYNAWTVAQLTAGYSVVPLQTLHPVPYAVIQTGVESATLPVQRVAVNHLSTRYIEFVKGNNDPSIPCFSATMTLIVTIPAGTSSKPVFYWDGGKSTVPLTINGNSASAAITNWDTCTWPVNEGWLSLPNASTSVDATDFVVNTSISIDSAKPAAPSSAPAQQDAYGQVIAVPSVELPPDVTVYGPELLSLSASDKQLRLIVQSNGDGSLKASIGSTSLGSLPLRAGANDLRYSIPSGLLNAVRSSAAASNVLTLTAYAASGGAQGETVTRKIVIQGAPTTTKATVPAKKKAKAKPASKSEKSSGRHK